MSHCDFNAGMAIALMDPKGEYHDVNEHGKIESKSRMNCDDVRIVSYERSSTKCARIADETLDPRNGLLNVRLVPRLNHLAEAVDKRRSKCCSLHRHATIMQTISQLIRSSICNVILCSSCFPISHEEKSPTKLMK